MGWVNRVRAKLKPLLPSGVRSVLRRVVHYSQRIGRWPIILWQVRGLRFRDISALWLSAFASPILGLRNTMAWQDPILLRDAEVKVRGVGRFSLRAWTDDLWHVVPWRERAIFKALKRSLGAGDIFVDAGANIGVYSVMASRLVGSGGSVIAVEMMPDTAAILRGHVRINRARNVTIHQVALSDKPGMEIAASVAPGKFGQASISCERSHAGHKKVSVTTATLDQILQDVGKIKLMKMDLEGAEERALAGAVASISKIQNLIYENNAYGNEFEDPLAQNLKAAFFSIYELDGNNKLACRE